MVTIRLTPYNHMPEQHALQYCAALFRPTYLTLLKEHVGLETVSDVLLQVPVLPDGFAVGGEIRCLCSLCKTAVPSDWLCQLLQHRTVLSHDYSKTIVPSDWLCQLLQQWTVAACWNSETPTFLERRSFHSINLDSEMPGDSQKRLSTL